MVSLLSVVFAAATCALVFLLAGTLASTAARATGNKTDLQTTRHELQQMADNIQEIFWTIDAETKNAIYVNQAYAAITGRSLQSLTEDPSSYKEVIHPDDRTHVLAKLEEAAQSGHFNEKFRIVRLRKAMYAGSGFAGFRSGIRAAGLARLVGTALEITAEKEAEEQVAQNLALARSAWTEADALRKATLGLTQDLRMDSVLDALLQSLANLVPYTCARVLIPEGGPHVLALGERISAGHPTNLGESPLTLNADDSPFLKSILANRKSVLISDTKQGRIVVNL